MVIARKLTANGKTQTVIAWAEETGINSRTIHKRLTQFWTAEQALGFAKPPEPKRVSCWVKTESGWAYGLRAAIELGINPDDYQ